MPAEPWVKARGSLRSSVRSLPREALVLPRPDQRTLTAVVTTAASSAPRFATRRFGCFMLLGAVLWVLAPRGMAYWRLHGAASAFANYALCMVGPTGPGLLRERAGEFWRLARRRLISSAADARPFADCAATLADWPARPAREQVYEARAAEFREYGSALAASRPTSSLDELAISVDVLDELSRRAWPFSRGGYAALVQPARHAKAALHPVELARPGSGRGLPLAHLGYGAVRSSAGAHWLVVGQGANLRGYRSGDGGKSWAPVEVDDAAGRALGGRCSTPSGEASFRLTATGELWSLESWSRGELTSSVPFGSLEDQLVAFACDDGGAVAILRGAAPGHVRFRQCPHGETCRALPVPAAFARELHPKAVLSIARARGTDVLSLAHAGIVRVISSRDDGQSWTPPVVAYDHGEGSGAWALDETPAQLLSLDERVVLYAGADRAGVRYPVLASDDFGASFRGL